MIQQKYCLLEGTEFYVSQGREREVFLNTITVTKAMEIQLGIFSLFIEIFGVTLINKITQVSGTQFHSTHLYTVLCVHHPKSSLLLSPLPLHPTPPLPPGNHHSITPVHEFFPFFVFAQSFHTHPVPKHPPTVVSLLSMSIFILIVFLFIKFHI